VQENKEKKATSLQLERLSNYNAELHQSCDLMESTIRAEKDAQNANECFVTKTNASVETQNKPIANESEEKAPAKSHGVQENKEKKATSLQLERLSNYNAELHQSCDLMESTVHDVEKTSSPKVDGEAVELSDGDGRAPSVEDARDARIRLLEEQLEKARGKRSKNRQRKTSEKNDARARRTAVLAAEAAVKAYQEQCSESDGGDDGDDGEDGWWSRKRKWSPGWSASWQGRGGNWDDDDDSKKWRDDSWQSGGGGWKTGSWQVGSDGGGGGFGPQFHQVPLLMQCHQPFMNQSQPLFGPGCHVTIQGDAECLQRAQQQQQQQQPLQPQQQPQQPFTPRQPHRPVDLVWPHIPKCNRRIVSAASPAGGYMS
jgi:hypothetical protein